MRAWVQRVLGIYFLVVACRFFCSCQQFLFLGVFLFYQLSDLAFCILGKKLLLKTPWVFNSHLIFSQKCDDSKTEFKEKF